MGGFHNDTTQFTNLLAVDLVEQMNINKLLGSRDDFIALNEQFF